MCCEFLCLLEYCICILKLYTRECRTKNINGKKMHILKQNKMKQKLPCKANFNKSSHQDYYLKKLFYFS